MNAESALLESARLTLRPLRDADCNAEYVGWLNDPEIGRFLETRHQRQSLTSIREFVATINASSTEFLFGIFLKENSRHIGNIKVGPIRAHHPLADVSLLIGARDCWGRGFATEAIAILSRYALSQLPIRKLSASMYVQNVGSIKAFLAAGYKHEGLRRRHYLLDAEMVDLIELGALAEDLT